MRLTSVTVITAETPTPHSRIRHSPRCTRTSRRGNSGAFVPLSPDRSRLLVLEGTDRQEGTVKNPLERSTTPSSTGLTAQGSSKGAGHRRLSHHPQGVESIAGWPRRVFLWKAIAGSAVGAALPFLGTSSGSLAAQTKRPQSGSQRLAESKLRRWEALAYGMFVCFGMEIYTGGAVPDRAIRASTYHPDQLDVDQWVQIAADAGMKYAVLTAKHSTGFCPVAQ